MSTGTQNGTTISNNDDAIVISGMSGIFPTCRNIKEFESKLYNKVNMVNGDESRWKHDDPAVPIYSGKIPELNKFDAPFFGVHHIQADSMDPQSRLLLEEAYKAIMDAGVNPSSIRETKTGVYVGACLSESESYFYYEEPSGFAITGCSKSMYANRISYNLGLRGPSILIDTACSSSMYAFNLAFQDLVSGKVEGALVCGSNLCLQPNVTLQFALLGVLSLDGHCRPFDLNANGYTRSEGIGCLYLQKKTAAKRIYATVVYSDTNCDGFKSEGITYPSGEVQDLLLKEIYSKASIDVNDIGFIEAHSTGTIAGDPEECKAIDKAICSGRNEPLLIGSVKSNCGHAEPASGVVSIVKCLFALQNNLIPPNINMANLRTTIESLRDGRIQVVTEPTILPKPYIGINSFGFGGANAHLVLKQYEKTKTDDNRENGTTLPRLVTWSSRTEDNANAFLTDLENKPLDPEYLALAQNVQEGGVQGLLFRGYSILSSEKTDDTPIVLSKNVQHFGGIKRPLVWVFSGMGSQWVGMGKSLMQIPLFNQSIQRSHNVLKPSGLDLIKIITSDDPTTFHSILNSFVGIAALQIALVDVLKELGVTPDLIIGHSVGELGCAYADNCFTAEQMILAAYYRGKVSLTMEKQKGSMAAVGKGFKDIQPILPETIEVGCHNSADSCTISGPYEDIAKFVEELQSKNIFAKEVQCSNIAYHTKYIAHFGPELLKYLKHIIPNPKPRSTKWISTSVPVGQWNLNDCKYSSAEYHTNNLLNSVLFEEGMTYLPKNCIALEIAPHALLESIMKNAMSDVVYVGITKRFVKDSTIHFLNALGSIYCNGVELNVNKLYPKISFPVSRGTSSISHLIEFDHSRDMFVSMYKNKNNGSGIKTFELNVNNKQSYLTGHEIDGRVLVPATYYLECVWKTFSELKGITDFRTCSIEFEDVKFVRATTLSANDITKLKVVVQVGTGKFEVTESQSLVASGFVREPAGKTKPSTPLLNVAEQNVVSLEKKDFYKELKLRGYHYNGDFQAVEEAISDGTSGKVKWTGNWVTFMDCMLQISIVGQDSRSLMLPTKLRTLRIFPQIHQSLFEPDSVVEVVSNNIQNKAVAGGIELIGLKASSVQRRRPPGDPVLEKYQFISHFPAPKLSLDDVARCCIQILLENQPKSKVKIVEIAADTPNTQFLCSLMQAVGDLPVITGNYLFYNKTILTTIEEVAGIEHITADDDLDNITAEFIVLTSNNVDSSLNSTLVQNMDPEGYIIVKEIKNLTITEFSVPEGFEAIAFFPSDFETFVLLHKIKVYPEDMKILPISLNDNQFGWLKELQEIQKNCKNVTLVVQNEPLNGILGLINCLRKEPDTSKWRCVFIDDRKAPKFDETLPLYVKQMRLGLAMNIYRKGSWGTYRHLKLPQIYPLSTRSDYVYGNMLHLGDMSSFKWLQGPIKENNFTVKVVYSSLNFRDIMLASGRLPVEILGVSRREQTCVFGFEYSGIDLKTDKPVMGMVLKSAVASYLGEDAMLSWEVPQSWSLKDAATVPVVYLTVYYAFFTTVDIRKGKSILIHAGSGGIGIAAIRVALAYKLEVYTTVSTPEKKAFLLKTFPTLKESNIGNSRDTSFEDMITVCTQGKGVDFVLNSLSEDKLLASVRCLGKKGHFLEIGKFDMANDNSLGLGSFLNELSFHAVLADNLLTADKALVHELKTHISKDIANGIIIPLPSTVFMAHEIEQAFRFLMSGKHIGKVLLQIRELPESKVTLPISVMPQVYFSPDLVYIVPGGLGGFGLELVDWMILRGASKIVLNSSRGISNKYQTLRISIWQKYSCNIVVNTSDISTPNGCLELIKESIKLGAIGGIFNLAVLLQDAIFENQTCEQFEKSFAPKAIATKYLDEISRKLCPQLQHFVIFSSVSCGRGNAGQTNYGMANSIMERIIEDRIRHALPGKAIQWGAVGEVGLVAELAAGKIDLEIGGTLQQRISSCLEVLDLLLSSPDPIVASMVVAEKKAHIAGQSPLEYVLNTMSIKDVKSVALNCTLAELGLDSLMGVEIKQTLERSYDILLNPSDLRSLTVSKLIELSENTKDIVANPTTDLTTTTSGNVDLLESLNMLFGYVSKFWLNNNIFEQVNNLTTGGVPIIIFPGIDGYSGDVWRNLGNHLKLPTYVLQSQKNVSIKAMEDLVHYSYQNITRLLKEKGAKSFYIVGYSFGAFVAHKTVQLLEKDGLNGKVIFIDGSHEWVEVFSKTSQAAFGDDDIEKKAVEIILSKLASNISAKTLEKDLKEKHFKEDRTNYIRETLQNILFDDVDQTVEYMESILQKIRVIRNELTYQSIGVLEAQILLIKPTMPLLNFDEYYGLKPFTRNTIRIETLAGNHQSILYNDILAKIINNYFC